jgi:hypothetical protein
LARLAAEGHPSSQRQAVVPFAGAVCDIPCIKAEPGVGNDIGGISCATKPDIFPCRRYLVLLA